MSKRIIALMGVLALVVAACGGDGGNTTTTGAPATTTTAPPATTTTEPDPKADWPDELVLGFVPSREAEDLQDNVDLLASILEEYLGIPVKASVTTDYTGLGVAMGTGQAHLGFMPPAGFVLANRAYPNIDLLAQSVRFGSSTYHAQYFTNDPSICDGDPIEGAYEYDAQGNVIVVGPTDTPALQVGWTADGSREDGVDAGLICPTPVSLTVIEGKTIVFVTETSASGYIFPNLQIRDAGLTDAQYSTEFGGSHDGSIMAVYNGSADIGVSFDDARRNVRGDYPDVGSKVIVFNITGPIANDVLAVDGELPMNLQDAIFQALADFIATEDGLALMDDIYSWTDLTRADDLTWASLQLIELAIDELGFGQ